jgi:hypothetical protein
MISLLLPSCHSRLLLHDAAMSMEQLIYWIGLAAVAVSTLPLRWMPAGRRWISSAW